MKNVIEFIKDKIYYLMGATVLIIVILVIISSCSSKGNGEDVYTNIENNMAAAAEKYFATRKNRLPKTNNGTVKVTLSTLIDVELMERVVDPNKPDNVCSGYVLVTKINKQYTYTPFLKCKGSYEPMYLADKVKSIKIDEYGAGVYEEDEEYIFKGEDVKNYIKFNDKLWRIIKVDAEGDVKVVMVDNWNQTIQWDSAYNSKEESEVGITTDYLQTDIRKSLKNYYLKTFSAAQKSRIVAKNLCVGGYNINEDDYESIGPKVSVDAECNEIKENEYIGLLSVSDYVRASNDEKCTNVFSNECKNKNYLCSDEISTWTINRLTNSTSKVFYIEGEINYTKANNMKRINPVIYLRNVIVSGGKGTKTNPYKLK